MFGYTITRESALRVLSAFLELEIVNLVWFFARVVNAVAWTVWAAGIATLAVLRVIAWVTVYLCVSKATKKAMIRKLEKRIAKA